MKRILFLIIVIFLNFRTTAADKDSLILFANNLYAEGDYEAAISAYEEVVNSGYEAGDLYYNLANAYYKSHKITRAILNYERALLLSPNDEDIIYNLNMAKNYVVDKIDVIPNFFLTDWINNLIKKLPTNYWAVISIISFILFLILFSVYLYINKILLKKVSFWLGLIFLFLSLSSFVFSSKQRKMLAVHNSAIIMSPSVTVKSSPDDSGTGLFVIHEGTKVQVEDSVGRWREIKLSDGSKGWLKEEDIVII